MKIGTCFEYSPEMQPTIDTLRTRYDEYISYADKQFEDFIEQLEIRNKLNNTVIILSSDHGESFEHNYLAHVGPHLYEQLTHIPLIIKEPHQTKGKIINNLAEQIDIPSTILELAQIPIPAWMEGRSLLPLLRDEELQPKPIISMVIPVTFKNPKNNKIAKGTIAVWEGDYKLIHYLEKKTSLLFNLKHDPDELSNLFGKMPEVDQHLMNLIQDNLKKANKKLTAGEDSL